LIILEPCFTDGKKKSGPFFVERRSEMTASFNIGRSMFDVRRAKKQLPIESLTGPGRTGSGRSGIARG